MEMGRRPPSYHAIFRRYMKTLAGTILLSQLFEWWGRKTVRGENGEFLTEISKTDAQITMETALTRSEIEFAKKNLKELSFVRVTRRGQPPKTWYTLDLEAYYQATKAQFPVPRSSNLKENTARKPRILPNSGSPGVGNEILQESQDSGQKLPRVSRVARAPSGQEATLQKAGGRSKEERHPRWMKFANRLADMIIIGRKMNRASRPGDWARDMEKTHTIDGHPIPKIAEVLQWYEGVIKREGGVHHLNRIYIPVVEAGRTFREKFSKLENAMARDHAKNGITEDQPKIKITVIKTKGKFDHWAHEEAEQKEMEARHRALRREHRRNQ